MQPDGTVLNASLVFSLRLFFLITFSLVLLSFIVYLCLLISLSLCVLLSPLLIFIDFF